MWPDKRWGGKGSRRKSDVIKLMKEELRLGQRKRIAMRDSGRERRLCV